MHKKLCKSDFKARGWRVSLLTSVEHNVKRLWKDCNWLASTQLAEWREPQAAEFYRRLKAEAYSPDYLINILPRHNLIYVAVPKVGSTRIRATLGEIGGRRSRRLKLKQWGKIRGPLTPRNMSVHAFYRLATSPATLRFSFGRNPYARLLSCWLDKFRDKPLVRGSGLIDNYLDWRNGADRSLPSGGDQTLSFEQFVIYATSIASSRWDIHIQSQDDIMSMPGIDLDFIGRLESFDIDFARVLDHLGASEKIRRESHSPLNPSRHASYRDYYTSNLAERVYRAYERDFERLGYTRALPRSDSPSS
jgi:Sulfotransferase family